MPALEMAAVLLGIAYLLLAVRESLWCWPVAFASTSIFLYLFWQVNLIMETALQVYYLFMAVYGWRQWRGGTEAENGHHEQLQISSWSWCKHSAAIASVVLASTLSTLLLQHYTNAALPLLDSFTTWGSILTTWMVTRKILENWLYWIIIDCVSIYLYLDRELYLTGLLFAAYTLIAIFGYRKWLLHYRQTSS